MKKQKTKKSILKRFKITSKGKLLRGHLGARHRRARKSKRRVRTFKKMVAVGKRRGDAIRKLI